MWQILPMSRRKLNQAFMRVVISTHRPRKTGAKKQVEWLGDAFFLEIEAVVKWLNTVEESESATMDEPTILTSARRGKSRRFESCLPMQYGNVRADGSSSHCGCEGPRFESETSPPFISEVWLSGLKRHPAKVLAPLRDPKVRILLPPRRKIWIFDQKLLYLQKKVH